MTGESANSQKMLLATAIAEGKAIQEWATQNGVPPRTACYWAEEPGPGAAKTSTVVGGKTRTLTAAKCQYVRSGPCHPSQALRKPFLAPLSCQGTAHGLRLASPGCCRATPWGSWKHSQECQIVPSSATRVLT
jgi:hypothetical protein